MDLYKHAAIKGLRFPSTRGELTVEQLYKMNLTTTNKDKFCLNEVAKEISRELKGLGEESFVDNENNPNKKALEIKLEIVKDVIATIQAENSAEATKRANKEKLFKLNELIERKENDKLLGTDLEELKKQRDALAS